MRAFFALYVICRKFTLFPRIFIAHVSEVYVAKNKLMFVLNFLVSPETVKYFFVNVVYLLSLKSSI